MIKEVLISFKKSLKANLVFILILTILSIGIIIVISSHMTIVNALNSYESKYNGLFYHQIRDNFVGEYGEKINRDPTIFSKLMAFCSKLKSSKDYVYYVAYENPLELVNYEIENQFLVGYENGDISNSKVVLSDGVQDPITVCLVKCIWCDEQCFSHFDCQITEGNMFQTTDYQLNDCNDKIQPILAGYEYRAFYDVGDEIPCDSYFISEGKLRIIGFLEKNTIIVSGSDRQINLDRYFVFPCKYPICSDVTQIPNNKNSMEIFLTFNSNGIVASKMSKEEIQTYVNNVCDALGIMPSFYVQGAVNQRSYKTNMSSDEFVLLLVPIFILIYAILLVITSIYIYTQVCSHLKNYSILFTFRFTKKQLCLLMFLEQSISIIVSSILSTGGALIARFLLFIKIEASSFLFLIILYIIVLLVSQVTFIMSFHKSDVPIFLRKLQ